MASTQERKVDAEDNADEDEPAKRASDTLTCIARDAKRLRDELAKMTMEECDVEDEESLERDRVPEPGGRAFVGS